MVTVMMIEIKNIKKSYGKIPVLRDISFTAHAGQCVGILGSNGCGKSTLLSILAGIQGADGGEFLCWEENLLRNSRRRSELVGYVPQGTPLIEELTAWDNLSLWYSKDQLKQELKSGVLAMLGVGEFLKTPVKKMSGGMKKRLSIGCAMATHPPILLLDEPMAALDLVCKQSICQYLTHHKESGGIILLTTHDAMELALCDCWYIIKDGCLEPFTYTGNMEELVKSL